MIISGPGHIEIAVAASQAGAYDFIEKPFNLDQLLVVIRRSVFFQPAACARIIELKRGEVVAARDRLGRKRGRSGRLKSKSTRSPVRMAERYTAGARARLRKETAARMSMPIPTVATRLSSRQFRGDRTDGGGRVPVRPRNPGPRASRAC